MGKKKRKEERMNVVPDDFSDKDEIGYDVYSAGLIEMIRSVKAEGSFTIGVFGQWGQGKTSMLRQIEGGLKKPKEDGKKVIDDKDILTVWFNPWQFIGEEHIIIPFFHTLVSYLEDFKNTQKELSAKVAKGIHNFFKELVHVPVALAYGIEGKIKIPLLLETKFKFKDVIDEARKQKEKIDDKSGAVPGIKKSVNVYESMYYRLISRLQAASNGLNLKIVVFIDDLDRCLPEKAVKLLEGIKVLLDLHGFVFVIGVARQVIEQGIRVRYRELYSNDEKDSNKKKDVIFLEQDYLDKIIQFPFILPPPDVVRLKSMVLDLLKDLKEAEPYLETIQKSLGTNPRSLKRCINTLSYNFWVKEKIEAIKNKKNEYRPELLIKMTLISFKFPEFYHVIGKTPIHLIHVQETMEKEEQNRKEEKSDDKDKLATGFPEIDDLDLFESPNRESIMEILKKQKRIRDEKEENDKGFEDEEEVRRYVSLLSVTTTSEDSKKSLQDSRKSEEISMKKTMESRMAKIEAGTVSMLDEKSGNKFTAEIKPFLIDKFLVTQDLFEKVMGEEKNRSRFKGSDRPVENVSWFDALEFCNLLTDKVGLKRVYKIDGKKVTPDWDANGFRLPSESEWEYACRAGTTGKRYGKIGQIAWYKDNSSGSTQGVKKKEKNPWELFDMLGNVWEWCWDCYGDYPKENMKYWHGPENDSDRVIRGGSWKDDSQSCTAVIRNYYHPGDRYYHVGFRLARSL